MITDISAAVTDHNLYAAFGEPVKRTSSDLIYRETIFSIFVAHFPSPVKLDSLVSLAA
jgi:hypothetical protein